jgi:hypothetical protein
MKLIIAPSPTDEVLGCSSILQYSNDVFIYYCNIKNWQLNEVNNIIQFYNCPTWEWFRETDDINRVHLHDWVKCFECLINRIKPKEIFIPLPCYSEENKIVYDAGIIALRPHETNYFVKRVFLYEIVGMNWGLEYTPNYYRVVNMKRKLAAYKLYDTQRRLHKSEQDISALAWLRGREANIEFAEAFVIKRWID